MQPQRIPLYERQAKQKQNDTSPADFYHRDCAFCSLFSDGIACHPEIWKKELTQ